MGLVGTTDSSVDEKGRLFLRQAICAELARFPQWFMARNTKGVLILSTDPERGLPIKADDHGRMQLPSEFFAAFKGQRVCILPYRGTLHVMLRKDYRATLEAGLKRFKPPA